MWSLKINFFNVSYCPCRSNFIVSNDVNLSDWLMHTFSRSDTLKFKKYDLIQKIVNFVESKKYMPHREKNICNAIRGI